jgi:hypothetical protein
MPTAVADGGQHEDPAAVRSACAAQALAVHRDRSAPGTHRFGSGGGPVTPALLALGSAVGHERLRQAGRRGQPGPQVVVAGRADFAGIQTPQDATQGLLARNSVAAQQRVVGQAEGGQFLGGGTPAPLRRRGDGVVARWRHRADHQGQQ